SGENNFFARKVDHPIAAGMRGSPMEQFELHARQLQDFLVFGDDAIGEMIRGWCASASGGKRGFLLLFIVLMSDYLDAGGEGCDSVDVISVTVCEDHGRY